MTDKQLALLEQFDTEEQAADRQRELAAMGIESSRTSRVKRFRGCAPTVYWYVAKVRAERGKA